MSRLTRGFFGALLFATAWGCAAPRVYGVQQSLADSRALDAHESRPGPDAATVLGRATTVAFFPPDSCTDNKAAGPGAVEVSNQLRLRCGVLMSELEEAAGRSGYNVVSWQTLRGKDRPIDYARAQKVDLLFEINELSFDIPAQDLMSHVELRFFEDHPGRPLVVPQKEVVGKRCASRFPAGMQTLGRVVALDMKMVDVQEGRVHWYYRIVRSQPGEKMTRTWRVPAQPSKAGGGLGSLGPISLGLGTAFAVAGLTAVIVTFFAVPEYFNTVLLIGGAVGLLGVGAMLLGVALIAGGVALNYVMAEHEPPDTVLCSADHPSLEEQADGQKAASDNSSGSVVRLEGPRPTEDSGSDAQLKELRTQVVKQFITDVQGLRMSAPRAPAPAPAPAPLPAPAPSP